MLKLTALLFMLVIPLCLQPLGLHAQARQPSSRPHTRRPTLLTQNDPVQGVWGKEKQVTIAGRVFDNAGLLPYGDKTRVVFDNVSQWDVFECWVGFRGGVGSGKGTTRFAVFGNGKKLFESDEMTPEDAPVKVSVSIKGCRGVTLAVGWKDLGENLDEFAVWADPTFRMGKTATVTPATTTTPAASTGIADDTTPDAAPAKNKILQISPARMDELATKLKAALAKDPIFSKSRPTLAIANFKLIPANALDPTNADNVREDLSTAIISTDTFNVVERGQLDQALKELKIGLNDTFDSATAQKLGRLVSAQVVLIGSISDRGSFVVINARLIDTATGRARAAANVEVR